MMVGSKVTAKAIEPKKEPPNLNCKHALTSTEANLTLGQIAFWQQTIGNQAVQRLLKPGTLHAKSKVDQPEEVFEQEAEHIAEQALQTPFTPGARGVSPCRYLPISASFDASVIQRQQAPEPKDYKAIGGLQFFDAEGNVIQLDDPSWFTIDVPVNLAIGIYRAKVTGSSGTYQLEAAGEVYPLSRTPSYLPKLLPRIKTILLVMYSPDKLLLEEKEPEKIELEPTVIIAGEDEEDQDAPEHSEEENKEENKIEPPGTGTKPAPPTFDSTKPGGEKTGELKSGEKGKETGEQTGIGGPGSKYGWLGLLKLPPELIKFLEKALEILGDEEEYLALRDLLQSLANLNQHLAEIEAILSDSDRLLAIALGVDENAAVDFLESWVNTASTKRHLVVKRSKNKGIVALAKKVLHIIQKVKKILRPIFKVRAGVRNSMETVMALMQNIPGLEEIIELSSDSGKNPDFKDYVKFFGADLSKAVSEKLGSLRASFKMQKEQFLASELVKQEEIARAISAALLQMVPKQYKPFVRVAQGLGLDLLITDHLIAPVIPEAVLKAINESLQNIAKKLDETYIGRVEAEFDKLLIGFQAEFESKLIPDLENALLQPSSKTNNTPAGWNMLQALNHTRSSAKEPLPEPVCSIMKQQFDYDFSEVRIHRDRNAAEACDLLKANAFTVKDHIYFGSDQYQPETTLGQGLLAHELTHVVQQNTGLSTGVIQRSYKDVLKKLSKKFGEKAVQGIFKIKNPGQKQRDKAEKILKKMKHHKLFGRRVYSATNPDIANLTSHAYYYVYNQKGKPKGIRRNKKWLGLLPALCIRNSKIELGFLSSFDPRKKDRAELRQNLGCKEGEEAHHIIPLELRSHPIVKLAEKDSTHRFLFNDKPNGIALLQTTHNGYHPIYTAYVTKILQQMLAQNPDLKWGKAERELFYAEISKIRGKLKKLNKQKRSIEDI